MEPVPWKCGKLATKCPWIYGCFYRCTDRTGGPWSGSRSWRSQCELVSSTS